MIDKVKVKLKAGDGGDGAVSFWREKFIPRGGPDGGDGGNGGSIYFIADTGLNTLTDFRSRKVFDAKDGEDGKGKKMFGKSAEDVYLKVPLGTLVFEHESEEKLRLVADLSEVSNSYLAVKGGRGGKGNVHFKSSTNQTPAQYIPGEEGEEKDFTLELKLVADVGLIGMPNAGKSTLINQLTRSGAKVGSYRFTTLIPNLGVWEIDKTTRIVVADIPGLVEGASLGKGLGEDFLRHIERTKVLVHMLDPLESGDEISPEKIWKQYQTIRFELDAYKTGLWELSSKPEIVVLNKIDITEVKNAFNAVKKYFKKTGIEVLGISAATGEGVEAMKVSVLNALEKVKDQPLGFEVSKPVKRYTARNLPKSSKVLTKDIKLY